MPKRLRVKGTQSIITNKTKYFTSLYYICILLTEYCSIDRHKLNSSSIWLDPGQGVDLRELSYLQPFWRWASARLPETLLWLAQQLWHPPQGNPPQPVPNARLLVESLASGAEATGLDVQPPHLKLVLLVVLAGLQALKLRSHQIIQESWLFCYGWILQDLVWMTADLWRFAKAAMKRTVGSTSRDTQGGPCKIMAQACASKDKEQTLRREYWKSWGQIFRRCSSLLSLLNQFPVQMCSCDCDTYTKRNRKLSDLAQASNQTSKSCHCAMFHFLLGFLFL